jgi:hypothetical protein
MSAAPHPLEGWDRQHLAGQAARLQELVGQFTTE